MTKTKKSKENTESPEKQKESEEHNDASTDKHATRPTTYGSPGPMYNLPSLTGQQRHDPRSYYPRNPAYSFGTRRKDGPIDSSPGPAYNPDSKLLRTGIVHEPRPTVTSRPKDPDSFVVPGPSLGPDWGDRSKGYSMGQRTKTHTLSDSPGPAAYIVPRAFGRTVESDKRQAPAYSVKSRTKAAAIVDSPGPGAYKVPEPKQYTTAAPAHSVKSRQKALIDTTSSAGPAAYYPSEYTRRNPPKFSFGAKHSPYAVPLIVPA